MYCWDVRISGLTENRSSLFEMFTSSKSLTVHLKLTLKKESSKEYSTQMIVAAFRECASFSSHYSNAWKWHILSGLSPRSSDLPDFTLFSVYVKDELSCIRVSWHPATSWFSASVSHWLYTINLSRCRHRLVSHTSYTTLVQGTHWSHVHLLCSSLPTRYVSGMYQYRVGGPALSVFVLYNGQTRRSPLYKVQ